ncbi:MAG: hypothetical protein ACTSRC_22285 [Candidatus Helarchaeota archaeon]
MKLTKNHGLILVAIVSLLGSTLVLATPPNLSDALNEFCESILYLEDRVERIENKLWPSINETIGAIYEDRGYYIEPVPDGYIIAGHTKNYGLGNYDAWVVKTNREGQILWNKTFGTTQSDTVYAADVTLNGEIYLGVTQQLDSDVRVYKIDEDGNELWNVTIGDDNNTYVIYGLSETKNGCIITGYIQDPSADRGILLSKINASGVIQWTRDINTLASEAGYSVIEVDDGFTITGYTWANGNDEDIILIKTNSSGIAEWNTTFALESGKRDVGESIISITNGYVIAGRSTTTSQGIQGVLAKFDKTGNLIWNQTYGGSNTDEFYWLEETHDGGFIIAGMEGKAGATDNGDAWLVLTSKDGSLIWEKSFGLAGNIQDIATCVKEVDPYYYVYTGWNYSYDIGNGDLWLFATFVLP